MSKFKDIFFHSVRKYIVLVIFNLALIITYLAVNGFDILFHYHDAFFLTGALMICFGGLSIVSYFGMFDMFGYSAYYVGAFARKAEPVRKYNNFYDYVTDKKEKRALKKYAFGPYFLLGIILIIVSLILLMFI